MTNEERFWKARDEYYPELDDPELTECDKCEGEGEYYDDSVLHDDVECEKCEGTGEMVAPRGHGMFV